DVAIGRSSPGAVDPRWRAQRVAPPLVDLLDRARTNGKVAEWLEQVQPRHAEYLGLQKAWSGLFARRQTTWPRLPQMTLRPGQRHKAVTVLRTRLLASGELASATPADPLHYDATLVDVVRAFQEHHGLKPTGVVDAATIAALN